MRMEATIAQIRALLQLAELDAQEHELPPETYQGRRKAIRRQVAGPLLERYQALRDTRRSPVIAAIERGSCSGCHLRLPTMVESQARRSPAVHNCPNCRRMLYAAELLAAEDSRASHQVRKMAAVPKADP